MFNSSGKFTIFFGQAHNEKISLTFFLRLTTYRERFSFLFSMSIWKTYK